MFLFLAIILHQTPKRLLGSLHEAVKGGSGIVIQFPFYAGIMGVMTASGLAASISSGFVSMAVAWGDAWTNLLQPFWALPVLAIAGLKAKDIMGYCLMLLIITGVIISVGLTWL